MMWGNSWGMGWWWPIGLLLLVGIVLLIALLVRTLGGGSSQSGTPGSAAVGPSRAHQILEERFAKGELTAEQYREQTRALRDKS